MSGGAPPAEPDPAGAAPVPGRTVMDGSAVSRALSRMAHQVLERDADPALLTVLGVPTRGTTLAHRLAERLERIEGVPVRAGALDVTLHRDDLHLVGARPLVQTTATPDDVEDRVVVLVDDVLFTGRTVRAALDALSALGRPRAVRLVVLVDRGHRALPVRADAVGKNLPTSLAETVRVRLVEHDGVDEVRIEPADPTDPRRPAGEPAADQGATDGTA